MDMSVYKHQHHDNVPRLPSSNSNNKTFTEAKATLSSPETKKTATTTATAISDSSWSARPDNLRLAEWRKKRTAPDIYDSWFANGQGKGDLLPRDADRDGPILDFAIIGYPKCGTTAMSQTLFPVTVMPVGDICTPIHSTVYYSYNNWPRDFGRDEDGAEKPLRGTKCPRHIEGPDLGDLGRKLPKTNLIVGIRHPVLWFQSFVNMQWYHFNRRKKISNYTLSDYVSDHLLGTKHRTCANHREMVCVARARFHLSLALLGKTPLDAPERDLLQSELFQAQRRRNDKSATLREAALPDRDSFVGVPNHVFLFESGQGKEEYFYRELAEFVRIDRARLPPLDNRTHQSHNGLNAANHIENRDQILGTGLLDICSPEFDHVRKQLLPISYTLQEWLLRYLVPASRRRDDLTIPNTDAFVDIVQGFGRDPCGDDRLVRDDRDGEYY